MKKLIPWIVMVVVFAVVGVLVGIVLKVGMFGWVIAALVAVLVGIMLFKKFAENETRDQKVYDEDKIYQNRPRG